MKIDKICKDLSSMKYLVQQAKPSSVEFNCSKCGKLISIKYYRKFLSRKHLLCQSCKMKLVNNKENDRKKRGKTRTAHNRERRASIERQEFLVKNEFAPRHLFIRSTFFDSNYEKNYVLECEFCHSSFTWNEYQRNSKINGITQHPYCKQCFNSTTSNEENDFYLFIKNNYAGTIIKNDRQLIKPKEIDVYLPELKLGFEFDGLHYHSGSMYSLLDKTNICLKNGIRLIHILESEWQEDTKEKTKSLVVRILKNENIINDVSFTDDNVLYVDKRFSISLQKNMKFIKTTNPRRLYFFNKHLVDSVVNSNDYIYNCGYDCYSLDGKDHAVKEDDRLQFFESKEIEISSINDIYKLAPYQKIAFKCPQCKKIRHYLALTMQNAEIPICGRCRQKISWKKTWLKKQAQA